MYKCDHTWDSVTSPIATTVDEFLFALLASHMHALTCMVSRVNFLFTHGVAKCHMVIACTCQ